MANRAAIPATAVLLVSAAFSAEAIEVDVGSAAVRGVTIASADIARDLETSAQMLVVRLRNGADEAGQKVTLAVTVHDENGNRIGMRAQQVEVEAAPASEQAFSQSIPSYADMDDTLTVELFDWANSTSVANENQTATLSRVEECEMDEATQRRVRDLREDLVTARNIYTEDHPTVIRLMRTFEQLQEEALADCVERLQ